MTRYIESAPTCLVEYLGEREALIQSTESLVILQRLLTDHEMNKVWEAIKEAVPHEIMHDFACLQIWQLVWSAIRDANTIGQSKGESDKVKRSTAKKMLELANKLDQDPVLREFSEQLLWKSYKSYVPQHEAWLRDGFMEQLLTMIEHTTPDNSIIGRMLAGLLSDSLSDLMRRYADTLIESTKNQKISRYGKQRPLLERRIQYFFESTLGRRSNEMTARVINAATLDCLTDQDIRTK